VVAGAFLDADKHSYQVAKGPAHLGGHLDPADAGFDWNDTAINLGVAKNLRSLVAVHDFHAIAHVDKGWIQTDDFLGKVWEGIEQ
jgi:hypothetical protein